MQKSHRFGKEVSQQELFLPTQDCFPPPPPLPAYSPFICYKSVTPGSLEKTQKTNTQTPKTPTKPKPKNPTQAFTQLYLSPKQKNAAASNHAFTANV